MKEEVFSVSVCMITYQHEAFVAKAIEGVLMQKTNFPFNLVIGDDCSKDNTVEIIKRYSEAKECNISLITHDSNVGMMPNFMGTLSACKGKYIAICEGDDYWTDENKLQKQFDFLEQNPDSVICFHNAIIVNEVNQTSKLFGEYSKAEYEGKDLLDQWLIPTASVFFRNILPKEFPSFFHRSTHGDLSLFMYLSEFGKISFIDEVMSAYRINSIGVTQSAFKGIKHNLQHVEQLELMKEYFNGKLQGKFKRRIANYLMSTGYLYAKQGEKKLARECFNKSAKMSIAEFLKGIKYVIVSVYYSLKY